MPFTEESWVRLRDLVVEVQALDPVGTFLFVNHFPHWQLNFERERELQVAVAGRFVEEQFNASPGK
jgi:hypothetical protein